MIALIITVVLFICIIILSYIFLRKLSGHEQVAVNEEEASPSVNSAPSNTDIRDSNSYPTNSITNSISIQSNTSVASSTANVDPRTLTKKDQRKMEKKKMKEDNREYNKMLLEEKKMREEAREKDYLEREMKRNEERKQEEELLRKLKEEQDKKENEIYAQWKDQFEIHEEGEECADFSSDDLINEFINYIKLRKVVSLEDLSGVYKIHPNDLVDRLNFLEEQGRITGIVDDRGKYIYLNEKELAAIEKIFMQRGRISKTELIKECNKIIRFEPTEEDKMKILEEQKMEWKKLEEQIENKERV